MRGYLAGLVIALAAVMIAPNADAACSGGSCSSGGCSGGSCNKSTAVTQNAATIDQEEQQIRELRKQINALKVTLNEVRTQRAIVDRGIPIGDDETIVNVGRSDESVARIQPIQLRQRATAPPAPKEDTTQTTVRAPGVRVQTGAVQPRARSGSKWKR